MAVYLIVDVSVLDPEVYAEYVERVPLVVEQYGGRYLSRGGEVVPLSGGWRPQRIILVEFYNMEQVHDFFSSPEYQPLALLRERATDSRAIIVEGVDF
jgi:uncharacterized protein (DUF1330 family)